MKIQSHSKSARHRGRGGMLPTMALAAVALAGIGGVAVIGFSAFAPQAASAEPAIPAGATFTSWADNGQDGQRLLQRVKGDLPIVAAAVTGIVKTDTNCDPDAEGINHCHNIIDLASGGEIEVIHNHSMMSHECLSPGQKLQLSKLNGDWIVARDAQ